MRVGGYPRVSTDEQAEQGYSLEEQTESIQKWCKEHGHPPAVIEPYIDDGYSAKDLRRPGIKRLLDDVQNKKYDIIVTTKLNRLSRKLFDILGLIDFFDKNNCNYVSVSESFDTSTYIGRMQMQMLGVIAEFDRERIAEDVRNTMKSIARKAGDSKKAFTVPCYGYDVVEGIYQTNIEQALVIDKIADMIIGGMGCRGVAKTVNAMPGVSSKLGAGFSEGTVRQLMRRETLKGMLIYNRTYKKNRKTYTRPQEEWIIIEDHHPAILDEQKWNDVQRALDGRKNTNKHADNEKWLLTGLLVCGHCGGRMKGAGHRKVNKNGTVKETWSYVCSAYHTKGSCVRNGINRDDLEEYTIGDIRNTATVSNVKKLQLVVSAPKSADNEKGMLEDRLKKLDAKMQKQIEAYEDELISREDLKKARSRIDEERSSIEKQLKELSIPNTQLNAQEANQNAKRHLEDILSGNRLIAKNAIRQVIQKIEILNGEEVKFVYHSL